MKKLIVGVMGPGDSIATERDIENAENLGKLIAENNWILLTGGMKSGVMDAASKGAKKSNGFVVGILPVDDKSKFSEAIDVPIITNMKSGRNYINALSSDIIIACGMGTGTASEVCLAYKAEKHVILLTENNESKIFFKKLRPDKTHIIDNPEEAVKKIRELFNISVTN